MIISSFVGLATNVAKTIIEESPVLVATVAATTVALTSYSIYRYSMFASSRMQPTTKPKGLDDMTEEEIKERIFFELRERRQGRGLGGL